MCSLNRSVFALAATLMAIAPRCAFAAPDLTCSIEAVVNGSSVTLSVSVTNEGDTVATNSLFDLGLESLGFVFVDSATEPSAGGALGDAEIPIKEVAPAETVTWSQTFDNRPPGLATAWCVINPGQVAVTDEVNLLNNSASVGYEILDGPVLEPDLVVTAISSTLADCTPQLQGLICVAPVVTVTNQGDADAGAFTIDIFQQDAQPDFATVTAADTKSFCDIPDGLKAGESTTVTCVVPLGFDTPGQKTVWAYVDFVAQIAESNDESAGTDNNFLSGTVIAVGPPDLTLSDLTVDQASDGAPIEFAVTVNNIGGGTCSAATVRFYWQRLGEPDPGIAAPDYTAELTDLAPGASGMLVKATQQGPIGGDFEVWVWVECTVPSAEISADNNAANLNYTALGVPNEPPVVTAVDGPATCHEGELCVWKATAEDLTGLPLAFDIQDGPVGMWADPATGDIYFAPPLGATASDVTATLRAVDKGEAEGALAFSFNILPPEGFDGKVAKPFAAEMPLGPTGASCPMVEVAGSGFAYVDQAAYEIRFFHTPTATSDATLTIQVTQAFNPPSPLLSCHLEPLPTGGFMALELNNSTALIFGQDGTLVRKFTVPGALLLGDMFRAIGGSTVAFLDVQQPPRALFVDTRSGLLDPTWGGNTGSELGTGVPGVLELWDETAAVFPYEFYLWTNGDLIRIYNRFFESEQLLDFDRQGQSVGALSIGHARCQQFPAECGAAVLPPDPVKTAGPDWFLYAAPDGGIQIVDLTTQTLQWYGADGAPREAFTLPAPDADPAAWPKGWVSTEEYGVSVNNAQCEPLTGGGFSCHNKADQRGYVLDAFAQLWRNCPILDISPDFINLGAISAGSKKTIDVTIANKGGGVLNLDGGALISTDGSSSGTFGMTGMSPGMEVLLFPGETYTFQVTFLPKNIGVFDSRIDIDSNACDPMTLGVLGISGAHLDVTPAPVMFTGVTEGTHVQTVTVKSIGSEPLQLESVTLENDTVPVFGMDPATIPEMFLEPGETFQFDVSFDGSAAGSFAGLIRFKTNSASLDDTVLPILGTTAPVIRATPPGFDFGVVAPGATTSRSVIIRNSGETPLSFNKPTLTAPPGFDLDTSNFVATLGSGESTSLKLTYHAVATSSQTALIRLTHDDPNQPPFLLEAVAGEGTILPLGWAGTLAFDATKGGAFDGPIGVDQTVIELSTGGFAVYGAQAGAIFVVTPDGAGDPAFGVAGRLQLTGPDGAFPDADGLGDSLIELAWGGFGLLDAAGKRLYVVGPSGQPNRFVGDGGVIAIDHVFPGVQTLARSLAQVDLGASLQPFVVVDSEADQLLLFHPEATPDNGIANGGILALTGADPVAGGGLATDVGPSLSVDPSQGLVFGDAATSSLYTLSPDAQQWGAPTTPLAGSFDGRLVRYVDTQLFYRPAAGLVTRHAGFTKELVTDFGDGGGINVTAALPQATLGGGVVGLSNGLGFGLTDPDCDCIHFLDNAGTPLELLPEFNAALPNTIDFGVVPAGQVSAPKTVDITNTGSFELIVTAVFDTGTFHLAGGGVSVTIPPGATGQLAIVFEPGSAAAFTGLVTLTTNDPKKANPGSISLLGSTGPHLCFSPQNPLIDFGNVPVGLPTSDLPSRWLTVCNDGADAITLTSSQLQGDAFELVVAPSVGQTLPAGGQASIQVRCDPPAMGVYQGSITVAHTDASQPPLVYTLRCASGPALKVVPDHVTCTASALGEETLCGTVSLLNVGTADLTIYDVTTTSQSFRTGESHEPVVLTPGGAAQSVTVLARPLTAGLTTATLSVLHDGAGALGLTEIPLQVELTQSLWLSPAALDFGALPAGGAVTLPISLHNDGAGDVTFIAATASPSSVFQVTAAPAIGSALPDGESAALAVRCAPQIRGDFTGKLTVATDAAALGTIFATLHCVAGAHLVATPAAVDFGAVDANDKRSRVIELTNDGLVTASLGVADAATTAPDGVSEAFGTPGLFVDQLGPGVKTWITATMSASLNGHYAGSLTIPPAVGTVGTLTIPLSGRSGEGLSVVMAGDNLDFGVRSIGSKTLRTALLVNLGSTPAEVTSVSFPAGGEPTVGQGPYRFVTSPVGSTVQPGQVSPITVSFEPVSVGIFAATIQVQVGGEELTVPVFGRAGGVLAVFPKSVAFGELAAGASKTVPLLVKNLSPYVPVRVKRFQSGDTGVFTLAGVPPDGLLLAPLETAEGIDVTFHPSSSGDFESTLTFFSDQGVEAGSTDVVVTGKSNASARLIYPPAAFHGFKAVPVGSSVSRPVRVAAVGAASVSLLGASLTGPGADSFLVGGFDAPPVQIAPGAIAELAVVCRPKAAGRFEAVLHLATDDPAHADLPISLYCTTPPDVAAAPVALDFGPVSPLTSSVETVVLSNTGEEVVLITSATLQAVGAAQEAFTLIGFEPDSAIIPGGELSLPIQFTPPSGSDFQAVLLVTTTDPVRPVLSIPVSGFAGPRLAVSQSSVNFCSVADTRAVTLSNIGTGLLNVLGVAFDGPTAAGFAFAWTDEGDINSFELAPGEERELSISYDGTITAPEGAQTLAEAQITASLLEVQSDDPAATTRSIRLVAGRGLKLSAFTGQADVGSPGDAPAFADADQVKAGLAELCTGGFVVGALDPPRLLHAFPEGGGAASALLEWGAADGETPLVSRFERAGVDPGLVLDAGAILASRADGLVMVGSSSAAVYLFLRADGTPASEIGLNGVVQLSEVLAAPAVGGAIAATDSGFVVIDRASRSAVGLTLTGALDPNFGQNGIVPLGAIFGASELVGGAVAVRSNGSFGVLDAKARKIFVVQPNGDPDPSFGDGGVLDLANLDALQPGPFGIGDALVVSDTGFAAVDLATARLFFVLSGGQLNPGIGTQGVVQVSGPNGAFAAGGALGHGLAVTHVVASPANAGKLVSLDRDFADLLFADSDGTVFSKGVPELEVSPCAISLLGVAPGNSATASVTVKNTGDTALTVGAESGDAIVVTGAVECLDDTIACDVGALLGAGDSRSFSLQWSPPSDVAGCFDELLTLSHDGVNGPITTCAVSLGTTAQLEVTPGSKDGLKYVFPAQTVGNAFSKEFIVRNVGCEPYTLQAVQVSGVGQAHFSMTKGLAAGESRVLQPGDITKVSVACKPLSDGTHKAILSFVVAEIPITDSVNLECLTGSRLEPVPDHITWGEVAMGSGQVEQIAMLSSGGQAATIDSAQVRICDHKPTGPCTADAGCALADDTTLPFAVVPPALPETLPVGATAPLRVIFAPVEPWACSGVAPADQPHACVPYDGGEVLVRLCGDATPDVLFGWQAGDGEPMVGGPVDFGLVEPGTKHTVTLTVDNIGGGILSLDTAAGASLAETVFGTTLNVVTLPMGAPTYSAELSCEPTGPGVFEATLEADSNAASADEAGKVRLAVRCAVAGCLALSVDTPSLVTWDQIPSTSEPVCRDVTVQNTGTAALSLAAADLVASGAGASFTVDGDALPIEVAAGDAVTFKVCFNPPSSPGSVTDTLKLSVDPVDVVAGCPEILEIALRATVVLVAGDEGGGGTDDAGTTSGADASGDSETGAVDLDTSGGGDAVGADAGGGDTGGGSDGCGCDMAPHSAPALPVGPALFTLLLLGLAIMLRRRA